MERLRLIAGSTRWQKRMCSVRPPRSRIARVPSSRASNPNRPSASAILSRTSGSLLRMRRSSPSRLPSESKTPARKPLHQPSLARSGHRIRSRIASIVAAPKPAK
jgi:hypothetical protein